MATLTHDTARPVDARTGLVFAALSATAFGLSGALGRGLMDAAKQSARDATADALWLDAYESAAGAGPFYAKCGFQRVGSVTRNSLPLAYYEWRVEQHRRALVVSSARGRSQP